jgi:hypothetical protein
VRTTGVRLIANLTQYKREMRDGAKDTRGLKDEVDATAKSTERLGSASGRVAKATARDFAEMRRHAADLDRQIVATQRDMQSLAKGFANSGDTNILKAIGERQKHLAQLKNVRALLPDADDLVKAGAGVGRQLMNGIGAGLRSTSMSPHLMAVAGGAALVAAPFIGATIAGAIIGGVGTGGVVGGLTLASRDARVKNAMEDFGDRLEERFNKAGGVFVQPALAGLRQLEQALGQIDFEGLLADAAELVEPLVRGVSAALVAIGGGIRNVMSQAGPAVRGIADGIAQIGAALRQGLDSLTDNGQSASEALRVLFGIISSSINAVFVVVNALTELWELTKKVGSDKTLGLFLRATGMEMSRTAAATRGLSTEERIAQAESEKLAEDQKKLAEAQKLVTAAQQGLTASMNMITGSQFRAAESAKQLKSAMEGLYGAAIQQMEANEGYEASWDSLTDAVKENGRSLNIHTAAGRANRDMLQGLLSKSNELYIADINAGMATDVARKAHEKRTAAVREEARRLSLNKTETQKLIKTYGQIPDDKTTEILMTGVKKVADALMGFYLLQRSLATGKPVSQVAYSVARERGMPKGFHGPVVGIDGRGYHEGGWTGHGGKYEPAGIVHRKEFVLRSEATSRLKRKHPGLLEEMNATGQVPGYAAGGMVAPVERRGLRYSVDLSGTRIPSRAEVVSKVAPAFGNWPSSPSAQRGDSGVWRRILMLIRGTGPMSGQFGNAYRHGDPKWHGSGRAVDWMGYNQDGLASFLAARRPLELIHRTNRRDYAYTRGRNKGSFNNALMEAHRNHIHIAMKNGGMIREPIFGVGASGATYSFGEGGVHERVIPMGGGGGGGAVGLTVVNHGVIGSRAEVDDWLTGAVDRLRAKGRI